MTTMQHKFKLLPDDKEIKTLTAFDRVLEAFGTAIQGFTFLALDFSRRKVDWPKLDVAGSTFIGCKLELEDELLLRSKGAFFYTHPGGLPYDPYRSQLYTWQELMEGFSEENDQSTDWQIYHHFFRTKFNPPLNDALCQRLHDHAIDEALRDLLQYDGNGMTRLRCVGFMGGHGALRTDPWYLKTAQTAKLLAEHDYYVVSGGGPGIMEAANLGAYMAGKSDEALEDALHILAQAPHYKDKGYHRASLEALARFPKGKSSLAIPTWFYGHEPSNLFASHIAKYFSNSIREDTLLAICLYGIVYAPGSAGTTQEIFQDATQNHYGTYNYYSPMVFLGTRRYEIDTLIFPLLKQLSQGKQYHDMLCLTDEPEEVLAFLEKHPPKVAG
jgi:predicted Rossmann-fold nucleotide-binding protein